MKSSRDPSNLSQESAAQGRLLAYLLQAEGIETPTQQVIPRRPELDVVPLSYAQERLWFLDQLEPGSSAYHISTALRLSGRLNVGALEQSLNEIVGRHEALRTTFPAVDGRPQQVISGAMTLALPVIGLPSLPEAEWEAEARRLLAKEAGRPFNLAQGPLLRATLLRLDTDDHILLLNMHHIVSDGWSMGILRRELSILYGAFSRGEPSPLAELPIQYGDYAIWQREWLQGRVLEEQLGYWKQQLGSAPPVLELPSDGPRPPVQTYGGARQSQEIPEGVTRALKALSQREGATLFMTLLAAFNLLLFRLTGQDDITVGTPIAGRNRSQIEELIGFFLNTLVLRIDLSGQPTFLELLSRVRETALAAYEHQDIPFEKLLEELQPERDLSRTPFFQVFFNMLPARNTPLTLQGLSASRFPREGTRSNFDLTAYVSDLGEKIEVSFVYKTDLFGQTTVESMLKYYVNLLTHIAENPAQEISNPRLLTGVDKRWLASLSNAIHPTNYFSEFSAGEPDASVVERFEDQVKTYGAHIAVKTRIYEWTYDKLNRKANQVARAILAVSGEGAERVGLMFGHDAPMLAAMMGALKAGKTYVPLDPYYPQERLAHILKDSMSGTIVADNGTVALAQDLLHEAGFDIINIDALTDAVADDNLNLSISPDTLAYILYTSGTTGEPKGVMQNHGNVLHHIRVYTNNLHIASEDRLTLLSTYGFDAAVMDVFGALLNGARLYPLDLRTEDVARIGQWMQDNQITIYHSTPTVYRHFISTLMPGQKLEKARLVVLGGEQVNREDFGSYREHFTPGSIFVNGYGPTESTLTLQSFLNHNTHIERDTVPIGYAVENTDIMLVNDAGQDTEIFGEIAIRSPHIALGYWQKPEFTEAAFLPDPDGSADRIYRTGDLGRLLPDGQIEFIGRKDTQVKIRGFRVELGEIEAQLVRHPSIKEAAAIAHKDNLGETRIVAFLVAEDENLPGTKEIHTYLRSTLPNYMLPASIEYIQEMPLTQTGKLDRRALPEPDWSRPELEAAFVAPRTPTEAMLADFWAEALEVDRVGIHDNFFELGGHSLLAVRLFALINRAFNVNLPLAALFQAPTIEELAATVTREKKSVTAAWSPVVPMRPTGSKPPLFVVPGNMGNVFTDLGHLAQHMGPDQPFYGLQDGPQNPIRIKAVATRYLEEIRRVQHEGPYLLVGVCSGAAVAFEIAQQLWELGDEVSLLALVEPTSPHTPGFRSAIGFMSSLFQRVRRRFGHHARKVTQISSSGQGEYARLKLKVVANSWAVRRYSPRPYPGRVEIFLSEASLSRTENRQVAWRKFAEGGAQVHEIPGSHAAIVGLDETPIEEAHMQALAEKIAACIDKALSDG